MQLTEQYRPRCWSEVIGQDKAIAKIESARKRGLAGRAYWVSGSSGTGKTTIARLIAAEISDEWSTVEFTDPSELTADRLAFIRDCIDRRPLGKGYCFILNEAHGCSDALVRKLAKWPPKHRTTEKTMNENHPRYRIRTQQQLRAEFWETFPELPRKKIKNYAGNGTMYQTDTRCAFADWVDMLSKNGDISQELAQRCTL